MSRGKTLQPQHWTERVRQILFLVAYAALIEYTYPTPFIQTRYGQLIYVLILVYIGKAFWRQRQERSPRFYASTQRWYNKWQGRKFSLSDYTRWRIMRIIRFGFLLYSVGWLIDGATDKCEGALACGAAIPTLLVQNVQSLVDFAIRLALSMFSIFGMMWIMARLDLHRTILPDSIQTRFTDVFGQDKAVERMREVQGILDHPEEVESQGGYMPSGILLTGPPGTGKTLLAEAFAGETGRPFVSVGPESFTNMFVGVPVLKVKMLFRHLRRLAVKHGGVVCFFDEIDALGSRGSGVYDNADQAVAEDKVVITGGGVGSGALQMLLTEMSGMAKPKGIYNKVRVFLGFKPVPPPKYRILWIGATNMPQALDPALLRPGRFDRKIKVGYPDVSGRVATLRGYLDKVQHTLTDEEVEILARENPHATGASIKDAVNEGLLKVIREGRGVITYADMRDSIMWKMLGEENGRMALEVDRWRVAVHEAAHAVASHHFRPEAPIQFASVIKRGDTGGMVRSIDLDDRFKLRSRLIADIKVSLASVWAEKHFFDDDISTGPSSDLQKATRMAKHMFARYAMGHTVMVWEHEEAVPDDVMEQVQDWLHELYDTLHDFMVAHRDEVELVAQLLDQYGTVDGAEVHALLDRMAS